MFTENDLASQDYDELAAMVLGAHSAAEENGPKPEPLLGAHLPAIPAAEVSAVISIRAMKYVNRFNVIAASLFSPSGLTVLYGENGFGKSSVARVLKQLC